jgi:excisionase family DNA binding protein
MYGKIIPEKESDDPTEAVKALESGLKILARMIVKAIMKELSTQERIPADTSNNLTMSTSRTSLSEQSGKSFAFSAGEVAKLLGVSKNTVYDAVRTGRIPSIRFGKRIIIPRVALVKKLEEAGNAKIDKGQY